MPAFGKNATNPEHLIRSNRYMLLPFVKMVENMNKYPYIVWSLYDDI